MKAKPTNQVANEQSHSPSPSSSPLWSQFQFLDFSASHWQLRLLPAVSRVTVEMWVGFSAGFGCNRAGHLIALSAGNEPAWPHWVKRRRRRLRLVAEEGGKQQQAESAPGACSFFDLALPPYLMILPQYCGSYHKDSSMGLSSQLFTCFSNYAGICF